MTDVFHEATAAALVEGHSHRRWIADAPADADAVMAGVRVLPSWIGLSVSVGGALILWAAILAGLHWAFAR